MTRLTVRLMIVEDLGYCCPKFFFETYKKTALIAARLGVSERAVRYARDAARDEPLTCSTCKRCLREKLVQLPPVDDARLPERAVDQT